MKKSCKEGYYYCYTDKECKKIPKGWHVMRSGYLMRDSDHEEDGNKKNTNGDSSNGDAVSEDVKGLKFSKFSHKTKHLSKSKHQLDPNLDLKQLIHHATVQYVDRDADGDIDVYDKPSKKTPDESVLSAPGGARVSSDALIKKQKGELKHTKRGMAYEETMSEEGLRDWYGKSESKKGEPGWVDVVDGDACAKEEGETATPKCVSSKKRASMSKAERLAAQARKRRNDPNQPKKSGAAKPTYVKTDYTPEGDMDLQEVKDKPGKGSGKKDACYHKVKSRYSVWPSAYASGALVKCRKVGAANWGESTNEEKDHEVSMAQSQLKKSEENIKKLRKVLGKKERDIPAWIQAKITDTEHNMDAAATYIENESVSIEDANGNPYVEFIDIIKPEPLKPSNWREELKEDWQKVNKSDKTDGMSPAAVKAYRRENPGSKLKTAVTGDPKPGSKDSKRRKSFCARSKGQQDMHNIDCSKTPDKAICKARRRWKC